MEERESRLRVAPSIRPGAKCQSCASRLQLLAAGTAAMQPLPLPSDRERRACRTGIRSPPSRGFPRHQPRALQRLARAGDARLAIFGVLIDLPDIINCLARHDVL